VTIDIAAIMGLESVDQQKFFEGYEWCETGSRAMTAAGVPYFRGAFDRAFIFGLLARMFGRDRNI
jgi:hypothetical protein